MSIAGMYPIFICNSLLSWFYCLLVVAYLTFFLILLFLNISWNWRMIEITSELILYSSVLFAANSGMFCCSVKQKNVFLENEQTKKHINIIFSVYVYVGGTVPILIIPFLTLYRADFEYKMTANEPVNKFYPVALNYFFFDSNLFHYFLVGNLLQYLCFINCHKYGPWYCFCLLFSSYSIKRITSNIIFVY